MAKQAVLAAQISETAPQRQAMEDQARRLLNGELVNADEAEAAVDTLKKLSAQKEVVDLAVNMMRPQVEKARRDASISICRRLTPTHLQLVVRQCRLLVELATAGLEEEEFIKELAAAEVSLVHPISTVRFLGERDLENGGPVATFLTEAAERGYLQGDEQFLDNPLITRNILPYILKAAEQFRQR